ncbi:DUF2637 domain-containing protein [Streptomyces sp. NPDC006458]|uniref:DUF2637 domain-containing protein n=1 Tax=Streptomyces sp. NPDC006458 TaxID=3154302 RepID=UPI0033A9C473
MRELAARKGFGNFSHVFPIGIDAGICVLLALDLLLTWIRIPLPLLRQTAWVLTAATIAFNGAAAWPDPLGTAMHAVIPILFVIAVEAARHATGRITDITHGTHMEGVRPIRWLLSPLPTFLLWRRMKLWELRSYDQVIKLEQERLVHQARLRSRYGRNWRRKAPAASLIPLRLARYGIPLTQTLPAGHSESPKQHRLDRTTGTTQHHSAESLETAACQDLQPAQIEDESRTTAVRQHEYGEVQPPTTVEATAEQPLSDDPSPQKSETDISAAAQAAKSTRSPAVGPATDDAPPQGNTLRGQSQLTTVDRYYLAWKNYQTQHGREPTPEQLSTHLADNGIHSRARGKPVSPSTLRRYYLNFRVYTHWAQQRKRTPTPSPDTTARNCTFHGITAQHNKPLKAAYITEHARDFERRWQTLTATSNDHRRHPDPRSPANPRRRPHRHHPARPPRPSGPGGPDRPGHPPEPRQHARPQVRGARPALAIPRAHPWPSYSRWTCRCRA